jgi:glutamyl-tRNA reductase
MRTRFNLPRNKASIESVLIDLCHSFFPSKKPKILFLGNSDINRMVMNSFTMKGLDQITLATRSPHLAQPIKEKLDIDLMSWMRCIDGQNMIWSFAAQIKKNTS